MQPFVDSSWIFENEWNMNVIFRDGDNFWNVFAYAALQTLFPSWKSLLLLQNQKVNSDSKWKAQNYIQNFISKKFRKQFYFLTCILPDYVFHETGKEFWQNSYFENMRAGFLKSVKIHFGKLALKWCIFRHDKNIF